MEHIRENIKEIQDRKAKAAIAAGRNPEDVLLVAVTKLHEADEMEAAIAAGITDIAENKVQEIQRKYDQIKSPVRWHLIGHLQTNKVKYIIDKVCMIHSVDSMHLAEEINKRAAAAGKVMDILIQVNAAGEESKFGVKPEEAVPLAREIAESCPNIRLRGLMHIAPYAENPEDVRIYFRDVKNIFEEIKSMGFAKESFDVLSMGMSGDFEVAIEEGSTLIRVGTSIFGARDYGKESGYKTEG